MATRWSSELMVAEHPDLQASAMTVDATGTNVLLAGRRYFGLKNLTEPLDSLKKFPRQSKYDVGAAEWNPHQHYKNLSAISTKDKVEIFDWRQSSPQLIHNLCSHTRVVSDLNWHQFDANQIASCSIDTFTYIWDLRDPRRPSISLSTVAGATQVRWNKLSRYLLATAHSGDVKLWDQRKGVLPVQYITAHLANIHCLDWDPNQESRLATSSQDCTVKFFDTSNPKKPENLLTAVAPVWRARYTPFGNGMLMVVVPPMRRGDNSLLLWNLANKGPKSTPIHTFVGHTDVVLEFEWRKRPDSLDYQLITWSKDQTLRIWQIEPFLQKLCGIESDGEPSLEQHPAADLLTSPAIVNPVENTVIGDSRSSSIDVAEPNINEFDSSLVTITQPKTLHQEFSLVNVNIHNVTFDLMDPIKRRCSVTARVEGNIVILQVAFPLGYPNNISPIFQFTSETNVDSETKTKLIKVLKQTALQRVKKNRSCLEPCIRQLVKTLEELSVSDGSEKNQHFHNSLIQHSSVYSSFQDVYIPFPRTSGAKFCNVGMLVCFGRTSSGRQVSMRNDKKTPRSFSALNVYSESPVTTYYYDRHTNQTRSSRINRGVSKGASQKGGKAVLVYDVSSLFPFQRDLAEKYVFDCHDVVGMCQRNSQVAMMLGRKDLGQVWSLAALAATPPVFDEDEDFPWASHPLSIGMIHSIIAHYAKQSDVQTAAMLCCAFGRRAETQGTGTTKNMSKSVNPSPGGSPYHTIHKVESLIEGWNIPLLKQNRSSSWSENLDEFHVANLVELSPLDTEEEKPLRVCLEESWFYEEYKKAYAEILHQWYLLEARAQVMKYIAHSDEKHSGLELKAECPSCKKHSIEPYCTVCQIPVLQCVICHTSVKGGANSCLVCGHGGHTQHMMQWFANNMDCPSGCGCQCLFETASVLEP
ncbi:unnamed protein product [Nezara viridula]|uniref:RWD domain-containing protein n=1 Tax=Nezara viridula TaxID=85310 RepID=A0A9P0H176_NEZVI|nr:unnamed protein product [Nezara viridula]